MTKASNSMKIAAKPVNEAPAPRTTTPTEPPAPAIPSKQSMVLSLLQRDQGATLDEMVAATRWLPHTTRAALTGFKKKGHKLESTKADGVRTYRIVAATGEAK